MTQEEAIENVAVATGFDPYYIRIHMENLNATKLEADDLLAKINALSKTLAIPGHPVSPYAKFDKFHRKKR